MTETLLEEVRSAAARVVTRARSVRIRRERLPEYAAELAAGGDPAPALDPDCHYLGHGDDTVTFVLCLDAINFGSGWFRWLIEREGRGGYFTLAAALTQWFEREGSPPATELAAIDADRCALIFGQQEAPRPVGELMARFAAAWRQLGGYVLTSFDGDFAALVATAGGSVERLVGTLRKMPSFDDVARYSGEPVPFFKRAQLAAVDLHLAFGGAGPGRFDDLDRLTIFADNQVPQVLRAGGVLELDRELARRIERGEEIEAGSPEEVEIRAGAVHAVELLVAELARRGAPRPAWELDQILWHRGLELGPGAPPAHRTRSVFY